MLLQLKNVRRRSEEWGKKCNIFFKLHLQYINLNAMLKRWQDASAMVKDMHLTCAYIRNNGKPVKWNA